MELEEKLKEQEELYVQLKKELNEHFPKGSILNYSQSLEYTSKTTRLLHIEGEICALKESLYNHNPHDDYWEVIEHCIDSDITPEFLMEIITIWRSLP